MTKNELNAAVNERLAKVEGALEPLTDEQAVVFTTLFPVWGVGVEYILGYRAQYGDKLYKCVQAHTSQADWTPDVTPALWVNIAEPGTIDVWKQPSGAHDAYQTGDKVYFPTKNDPIYISTVDNNIWVPDVYGWEVVN